MSFCLLDNEDDVLKQFFICQLKFFRKVVAGLDRYLIPAQANSLLTHQETHSIFSNVITIITITKRILQCISNGASKADWQLGKILYSTHADHLPELMKAYTTYGNGLGSSATVLANKMTFQLFAKFVLETPVPKGHLDMTSLLLAPLEHLRNLCEICDEIVHSAVHWSELAAQLKECYADIVCATDFMEPISHLSMKKHPLLSVRDLEKRIVSTTFQDFKVNEKGRKWLFGSRLFRKESDGSWAPVWAFLFTDIIVLTSHTTRDRVFFVKEPPIQLEDVVTLHFNLPRKNENEFRLVFGPEIPQNLSRFDKILPLKSRVKKPNQIILRTPNQQLKSLWKLLLQRQIITLNTRISKSSSSNFSISEFCEKFPEAESPADPEDPVSLKNLESQDKVVAHGEQPEKPSDTARPTMSNHNIRTPLTSIKEISSPHYSRSIDTEELKVRPKPVPRQSSLQAMPKSGTVNNNNNFERDVSDKCHCEQIDKPAVLENVNSTLHDSTKGNQTAAVTTVRDSNDPDNLDLNKNSAPETAKDSTPDLTKNGPVYGSNGLFAPVPFPRSRPRDPVIGNIEVIRKPEVKNRVNFTTPQPSPIPAPRHLGEARKSNPQSPITVQKEKPVVSEPAVEKHPEPEPEAEPVVPNPNPVKAVRSAGLRQGGHTDSPIISGVGSEARRRLLYDYKVKRDYPELFGISPRDRRSFIKSLGEKAEQDITRKGGLVTPYYYISPSPSPLPIQRLLGKSPSATPPPKPRRTSSLSLSNASSSNSSPVPATRSVQEYAPQKPQGSLDLFRLHDLLEEVESDGAEVVKGVRQMVKRQERSPEESSSNDSGISDEMVPEKLRKSLDMANLNLANPAEASGGMEPVVALKADKATGTDDDTNRNNPTPTPTHTPSSSSPSVSPAPRPSTSKPKQPLTMAQRREAFFLNRPNTSSSSSSFSYSSSGPSTYVNVRPALKKDPVVVKILEGDGVQRPAQSSPTHPPVNFERVQYTRLEREGRALVERVESSDESTSSDPASASPAENGTTDPSWSSSTASIASGVADPTPPAEPTSEADAVSSLRRLMNGVGVPPTAYYHLTKGPEIVVTEGSPPVCRRSNSEEPGPSLNLDHFEDENEHSRGQFLRVGSNESTIENYGDDDEDMDGFDDEEDLSHGSVAAINRYGTYESLERIDECGDPGGMPDLGRAIPRSKARFTFEDEDDDEDLFEEDFESDFNFRFPSQIQDNTYSVSRLGPLPPLLEEDYEDEAYEELSPSSVSPGSSRDKSSASGAGPSSAMSSSRHGRAMRGENNFLLTRIASMYARSSISPLKIFRDLWLKKRYGQWNYKE